MASVLRGWPRPLGSTGPAAAGTLLTPDKQGTVLKKKGDGNILKVLKKTCLDLPVRTSWCWRGAVPPFRLRFSHMVQCSMVVFIRTLVLGGAYRGRSLSSDRDGPLHTANKTLCRKVRLELERRRGSLVTTLNHNNPGHHTSPSSLDCCRCSKSEHASSLVLGLDLFD